MDRDSAGDEAAEKLCTQLKAQGVTHLRAATPEGYKDPNELLMGDRSCSDLGCEIVLHRQKNYRFLRENVSQDIADTEALRALQPESNPALSQHRYRKQQALFGLLQQCRPLRTGAKALVYLQWKTVGAGYRRAQGDGVVQETRERAHGLCIQHL